MEPVLELKVQRVTIPKRPPLEQAFNTEAYLKGKIEDRREKLEKAELKADGLKIELRKLERMLSWVTYAVVRDAQEDAEEIKDEAGKVAVGSGP